MQKIGVNARKKSSSMSIRVHERQTFVIAIHRMSHSLVRITVRFPDDHCLAETREKGNEGPLLLLFLTTVEVMFSEASSQLFQSSIWLTLRAAFTTLKLAN